MSLPRRGASRAHDAIVHAVTFSPAAEFDVSAVSGRQALVVEGLVALPDQHRRVLVLAYYRGMSCPELAQAFTASDADIKAHLHLAVRTLSNRMSS